KAAQSLAISVNKRLDTLGMPAARFDITLTPTSPGPHGIDQVVFQFAGHESIDLRPLAKVASGGELSRVSLAIAVSAAQANPVQSLIFDEADAGVGGSVADAIGLLMRTLGESRQVLAVTHLPQVAARAHHQYRVSKQSDNGQITSTVTPLSAAERVDEIARMLGGARVTSTTRQHATELLTLGQTNPGDPNSSKQGMQESAQESGRGTKQKKVIARTPEPPASTKKRPGKSASKNHEKRRKTARA
ncbi:MAG: hypothetical protein WBD51_07420, partial [Burkholderiaceae bacterium]